MIRYINYRTDLLYDSYWFEFHVLKPRNILIRTILWSAIWVMNEVIWNTSRVQGIFKCLKGKSFNMWKSNEQPIIFLEYKSIILAECRNLFFVFISVTFSFHNLHPRHTSKYKDSHLDVYTFKTNFKGNLKSRNISWLQEILVDKSLNLTKLEEMFPNK